MSGNIKHHRAMELSEIAVALGVSIATVKSIEDRALAKLRKSKVLRQAWAYSGERRSNNFGTQS
jgi:DNA-directed RNA polymerase specialized sigma24 family protein